MKVEDFWKIFVQVNLLKRYIEIVLIETYAFRISALIIEKLENGLDLSIHPIRPTSLDSKHCHELKTVE